MMKARFLFFFIVLFGVFAKAQTPKFTIAKNEWNADSLGNQRAMVVVSGNPKLAKVKINWRRSDLEPEQKAILIKDAKTGKTIENFYVLEMNAEQAVICFEPLPSSTEYEVYYLLYKSEGRSNYPKGVYAKFVKSAGNISSSEAEKIPFNAKTVEIQSINSFNKVFPMEVIATAAEVNALQNKYQHPAYLVFPESRMNPIIMKDHIPQKWQMEGPQKSYAATALRGENFSYQLGVYALKDLQAVKLVFSDLKSTNGGKITKTNFSCLNTNGTTYDAKPLTQTVNVAAGKVQAMWCLINIPEQTQAGIYKGIVQVQVANAAPQTIAISLQILPKKVLEGGVNEPWKQTRLTWLNSTLAQKNTVIAPYTALQVTQNTISLLGRKVELAPTGFPAQIQTFFTEEMTGLKQTPNNLLIEPIHFHFIAKSDGKDIELKSEQFAFTKKEAGTVEWKSTNTSASLKQEVTGHLEFDGFLDYTVKVTALNDVDLQDIAMHIPFEPSAATYMMGLGQKGGYRPEKFEWKWDVAHKNQDGAWLGTVNAGLQYSLRDEHYVRPLNTNFYLQKPLLLPTSWGNQDKGGISIGKKNKGILANNYSGERRLKKGEVLYFNFHLLITPFHAINTDFQWANRFYHKYDKIENIKKEGATLINIHHNTPINPWINYPFIEWAKMKAYVDSAHKAGLKVKIYNTVRELSNHAYETFPMRSLGHEVYSPGKGGGFSWLQEHIKNDYIAAWFVPTIKDAAIVNSGMNRWHNYYVEGMNWLTQKVGIDGIYLDDVAFDRVTMKRVKRVLTQNGHPGIIDLHSANQYNENDGFNNSANLYMEHFPYLNRLWFGEYFDYENGKPDFYLTEVSGIPFGLMGEMLQDGGNRWRGMVYGMTNRWPWEGSSNPQHIWKLWDSFGMQGSKMIGYWSSNCPVKTNQPEVLATVYQKPKSALIAVASWAAADVNIKLQIDWQKLGINPQKASIRIPEVADYQTAQILTADSEINIPKNKGFLILIEEK